LFRRRANLLYIFLAQLCLFLSLLRANAKLKLVAERRKEEIRSVWKKREPGPLFPFLSVRVSALSVSHAWGVEAARQKKKISLPQKSNIVLVLLNQDEGLNGREGRPFT
jgi:hypothetical protein